MKLRILFVEDHHDTRHVLSKLLRHFGYLVDSAENYRLASDLLATFQFHVLVCDIGLPDGNGCDLVKEAKRRQPLVSIALTAYTSRSDVQRGRDAGFDHYLCKPCDVGELRTILSQVSG
jgi:DNA-binding response OmpR family regulator